MKYKEKIGDCCNVWDKLWTPEDWRIFGNIHVQSKSFFWLSINSKFLSNNLTVFGSFLNREQIYLAKKRPKTSLPLSEIKQNGTTGDGPIAIDKPKLSTAVRGQSARCMVCSGRYVKKNQVSCGF